MKIPMPEVRHDQAGFEALVGFWTTVKACFLDEIELSLAAANWFDADMCAPFGALLYALGDNLNSVGLTDLRPDVESVLAKNGFLSSYGRNRLPDQWGTTLHYKRFEPKDDRYFASYIEEELMHRAELPDISFGLLKKLSESIIEIFSNSVIHSRTRMGIFACGQFYPHRRRLNFCVADLGIGIHQNVVETTGLDLDAAEAIMWATDGRNTTRRGSIPGGLGLKLLVQFIDLNGGLVQIVSDRGYWRRERRETYTAQLHHAYPGTVVCIEINTADKQSYVLSSEQTESDIF
jgi:hypothetical protein